MTNISRNRLRSSRPCAECSHAYYWHNFSENPIRWVLARPSTYCDPLASECDCQDYRGPKDFGSFLPGLFIVGVGGFLLLGCVLGVLSIVLGMLW